MQHEPPIQLALDEQAPASGRMGYPFTPRDTTRRIGRPIKYEIILTDNKELMFNLRYLHSLNI